jgi:hypothetical protein
VSKSAQPTELGHLLEACQHRKICNRQLEDLTMEKKNSPRLVTVAYETLSKKAARRPAVHVVQHEPKSVLSQVWVS